MKYTTKMAEEQEINGLLDALCNGCIELNENFLNRYTGEKVKDILLSIPEGDRGFHLSSVIDEDNCFFNGSPATNCDNDIWLDVTEIEVQFEGKPEDFFDDPEDWYIKDDLAYHYVGYGLIINVDVDTLKENIEDWYQE